jgi:hypothetical protein
MKGLTLFIIAAGIGFYLLTNIIGKFKEEDNRLMNDQEIQKQEDMKGYRTDVVGDTVLVYRDTSIQNRIGVWKRSPLHEEYLNLFPNFSEMELFVDDRVQDDELKAKILKQLKKISGDFFSGTVGAIQAKEDLDKI